MISAEEYDRLIAAKPTLIDHLLNFPELDDETIEEINRRTVDPPRPLDL